MRRSGCVVIRARVVVAVVNITVMNIWANHTNRYAGLIVATFVIFLAQVTKSQVQINMWCQVCDFPGKIGQCCDVMR